MTTRLASPSRPALRPSHLALFGSLPLLLAALGCSSTPVDSGAPGGRGGASRGGEAGQRATGGSATGGNATGGSATGGRATGGSATGGRAGAEATGGHGKAGAGGGTIGGKGSGGSTTGGQGGGQPSGGAAGGRGGTAGASAGGSVAGGAGRSGAAGAGGTASTSALLDELGKTFCAAARGCCAKKSLPTSLADCEAQFPARLQGLAYVKRGTVNIDDVALARCLAAYKDVVTTCAFQPLDSACQGVWVGTKGEGAACGMGGVPSVSGAWECKATGRASTCLWTGDSNLTSTTGVCHAPAHAKKGEPCAGSCGKNERCVWDLFTGPGYPTAVCFEEDGVYCASGAATSVCAPIIPTGANCEADPLGCGSTERCTWNGTSSVCVRAPTLGQSCTGGVSCASGLSLFCDSDTGKCQDLGFAYDSTCTGQPPLP